MSTVAVGSTKVHSKWASGNLYFYESGVGRTTTGDVLQIGTTAVTIGNSAQDVDFKVFLGASTDYISFDVGDKSLYFAGLTKIDIGLTGTPLVLTAGTPIFEMFSTCASTSGSTNAESFLVTNTMTGIGGVGGRSRFYMTTNVALAGWSNALKANVQYGAAGKTTGLGSAFCAEMGLTAGNTSGTYAPLESEIVLGTSAAIGTATSFLYANVTDDSATFNTGGYLLELGAGVIDTTSGLFDVATITPTSVEFDARLRIRIGGVDYFIPLSADAAFE